jgi:hypothetical protein
MKYLCMIFSGDKPWSALSQSELDGWTAEQFSYGETLRQSGHYVSAEALQHTKSAATVRVRNGHLSVTDGPYVETNEQLGGFFVIEARDLNDAIRVASKMPLARFGNVEVRPIRECAPSSGQ